MSQLVVACAILRGEQVYGEQANTFYLTDGTNLTSRTMVKADAGVRVDNIPGSNIVLNNTP
jgi:hypothetical protein